MTERDQEEQNWRIEQMFEDIVQKRVNEIKLLAEADKLRWDRRVAPWVIASSVIGGIAGAFISHFWR